VKTTTNLDHERLLADMYGEEAPFYSLMQSVAEVLRNARSDAGLTQRELAAAMNTSQAQVVRLEAGNQFAVTLRSLFAYAEALGYDLCVVLEPREDDEQ